MLGQKKSRAKPGFYVFFMWERALRAMATAFGRRRP